MLVLIDISLDVLTGLGSKLTNSLWKVMCGYLFIKKSFVNNNELLKKIKYGLVVWMEHHKMKKKKMIHIPNLLLGLNI